MNDELKRCQSCGSRATIVDYEGASLFGYYIACRNRKCELSKMPDAQNLFRTEAEAIAAWNARADEPVECNNIDGKCSRCGKDLPEPGYTGYEYEGSYCPTCGAKVRKDSENKELSLKELTEDTQALSDSREQLESEVMATVGNLVKYCGAHPALFEKAKSWLDRQAAITRAEVFEDGEYDCRTCDAKYELQERVDSLTDERDHFRKHVNHLIALIADIARKQPHTFDPEAPYETLDTIGDYLDELQGDVANLTSERDYWKDQVHQCVIKAVEPGGYTAGIMRYPRTDGYCEPSLMVTDAIDSLKDFYADEKRMNDKLTAERDELQSIIDHMPKTEQECEACQDAHDRLMFNAKVDMDELRDELKHKQLVIDRQRDSFLKMEAENAELRRMLADAAEAI